MKNRIKSLELKVTELQKQNENLTAINDGLVDTLEAFKCEQNKMWNAIRKQLIPTPQNMTNSFVCETEDGHHVHQVKWDMPLVKGYRIYVDGSSCGQIIGKNNSARITDLSANESHVVQIQVSLNSICRDLQKSYFYICSQSASTENTEICLKNCISILKSDLYSLCVLFESHLESTFYDTQIVFLLLFLSQITNVFPFFF